MPERRRLSETLIKSNLLKPRLGSCCSCQNFHDPHWSNFCFCYHKSGLVEIWTFPMCSCRREQAVEKKYPGTYKRHLVRPIVRPNAVEKLIKKKSGMNHKPGTQQPKRWAIREDLCAVCCVYVICLGLTNWCSRPLGVQEGTAGVDEKRISKVNELMIKLNNKSYKK